VQHGFDAMGKFGDVPQPYHGRRALKAVGRAERLVQVGTIPLAPLQVHQSLFQADEELPRFFVEHLAETVVRARTHFREPSLVSPLWTNPSAGRMPPAGVAAGRSTRAPAVRTDGARLGGLNRRYRIPLAVMVASPQFSQNLHELIKLVGIDHQRGKARRT